ncbi:hypothetical protein BC940DRAFT_321613 [Gongronella butleri]|nr:hypothetical protein BC940DRAFT_321613 [Gongronella butleri]
MCKLASLIIVFNAILILAEQTFTEVHLNYYMSPYNDYGGTVCNLNYNGHRQERYLTFSDIKKLDPELHCTEKPAVPRRCGRGRCIGGHPAQVNCLVGTRKEGTNCEKVKRVCEDGMLGGLQYGTCVPTPPPKGDCCYVLEDGVSGHWTRNRVGKCPFLCFGLVDPLGAQWCKSCSCNNPESGTGQGGSKSYSDLC